MLLAMAERRLGIAERLAHCFPDRRDPLRIHDTAGGHWCAPASWRSPAATRTPTISSLCASTPLSSSLAGGFRSGANLCSQPTLSRLENAPSLKDAIRLTWALVDQWMVSYEREPASSFSMSTTLRCRAWASAALALQRPLRRALLPADPCLRHRTLASRRGRAAPRQDAVGVECARILRRLVRHSPFNSGTKTRITSEATATTPAEAMEWCEANRVDNVFDCRLEAAGEENRRGGGCSAHRARFCRKQTGRAGYAETCHKAKSWSRERRAVARIEATPLGLDTRFRRHQTSNTARPNGSTTPSIARADRPRTSSNCTRRSSLPIERPAVPPSPIRCASCCTRRLTGSCSLIRDAIPRNRATSPTPNSRPCGCG